MAEIMDPFAYEQLAGLPPHGFDLFSCGAAAMNSEFTMDQMDEYFRATGALPSYTTPAATRWTARDMERPATCDLYAAAAFFFDAHVEPTAAAVPPPAAAAAHKNSTAPYDADIDASLRATEADAVERPSPDYLETTQGGRIDAAARASLVQWMLDFARRYYLDDDAILHRAVSYVDRYLSARALAEGADKYQLRVLGAVALHAAAKFEDVGAARELHARDIACWCGYDTTHRHVLDTERALLAALGYRLAGPTAHTFVDHFLRHGQGGQEDLELWRAAHHIAGTSLFDYRCLKLLPSAVAAAAIFLAKVALKPSHGSAQVQRWSRELEELTGYKPVDVRDGVECMYRMMDAPGFVIFPAVFFADPS